MIQDFSDLCTYVYVLIDDLYQAEVAPHDHRPGPRSMCSESEIITLTLVAELIGQDEEGPFLAYVRRNHPTLFPRLPERTRYNRRRRGLIAVTNSLRLALMRRLLRRLDPAERTLCLIDSLPLPVVGFAHARGHHRWYGEAAYGYCAAKKLTSTASNCTCSPRTMGSCWTSPSSRPTAPMASCPSNCSSRTRASSSWATKPTLTPRSNTCWPSAMT